MERLPLPDYVTAQQKVTPLPNGGFARDRLMVIQKTDVIPMVDPVVRDFVIKQEARQRIQDVTNGTAGEAMLIMAVGQVVLMPILLAIGLWLTR